jgi:hypothetical protein
MDISLDESSVIILRQIFDCSDLDKDGKVSRSDLKLSLGLQSQDEADRFFGSLKTLAGGNSAEEYLTFDEYCKGIMDFPDLLEKFRQDLEGPEDYNFLIDEKEIPEREISVTFLPIHLKECINIFNKSLKADLPYLDSDNAEDLLAALRLCLEKLRHKAKDGEIVQGAIELLYLVRDLHRFHEEAVSDLQGELNETRIKLDQLESRIEKTKAQNENLMNHIQKLEYSETRHEKSSANMNEVNQSLRSRLQDAENQATDTHSYIKHIEKIILDREKQIARMEKELRQLNSLKTIQAMRVSTGKLSEDHSKTIPIKRKSVPIVIETKKSSSSNADIKITIISNQLKAKNEELQQKSFEVDQLGRISKKYIEEINRLREENFKLLEKVKELQYDTNFKKSEGVESIYIPSLYEELQKVSGSSFPEDSISSPRILDSFSSPRLLDFNSTHKAFASHRESSTQTITAIKKEGKIIDKNRSCCSWF